MVLTILSRASPGNFRLTVAPPGARDATGMPKSPHTAAAAASGATALNWYHPSLPTRKRPLSRADRSTTDESVPVVADTSGPVKRALPSRRKVRDAPSTSAGGSTLPSRGTAREADSSRAVCLSDPDQLTVWTSSVTSLVPAPGAVSRSS